MKKKILILCIGNSCRSQMAHGFLNSFDNVIEVYSAGTKPAEKVNPMVVKVMSETSIDISHHIPKNVNQYLGQERIMFPPIAAITSWTNSLDPGRK